MGNHVQVRCNVRIIAATHRNLEDSIAHGLFREDLYHRLNVFPIEMPALRSRIEDLPLLVRDFIAHNMAEGRGQVQLSPLSLAALSLYRWTGNVRELGNLIERLSIVCSGRIAHVGDLPAKYRPSDWTAVTEPPQIAAAEQHSHMPLSQEFQFGEETAELLSPGALLENADAPDQTAYLPRGEVESIAQVATLPADGIDLRAHLTQIERRLIEQALERSHGTVAHARACSACVVRRWLRSCANSDWRALSSRPPNSPRPIRRRKIDGERLNSAATCDRHHALMAICRRARLLHHSPSNSIPVRGLNGSGFHNSTGRQRRIVTAPAGAGTPCRSQRLHGADRRRIRHRQGSARALRAPLLGTQRRALCGRELRSHPREHARGHSVRLRARRLHRRPHGPPRKV